MAAPFPEVPLEVLLPGRELLRLTIHPPHEILLERSMLAPAKKSQALIFASEMITATQ